MFEQLVDIKFRVEGATAFMAFNRPERLNALTPRLINEAVEVTEYVASKEELRALVIEGNGDRAFSAGVDLHAVKEPGYNKATFSAAARYLAMTWETMPQVTIAKVKGFCFTGALELALACDFIICTEGSEFSDTHARLGFVPSWGMVGRLPQRVGTMHAKQMSFTSRRVSGAEAKSIGLVLDTVPEAALDSRVEELTSQIANMSRDSVCAYKNLYRLAQNMPLDGIIEHAAFTRFNVSDRAERLAATREGLGRSNR